MYGLTLAVVYEDPASARRQVFLNEGFDLLGADETQYGTTPEEATAYIPFSGMTITPEDAVHASLTTFVPSGNGPEGDLLLNGVTIDTGVWDYGLSTGTQVAVDTRDVKSSLLTSGNEAGIRSTATGATPVMAASLAFLVIEYPESGPVAGFSVNVTSGTAPLAVQFTDQSTGQVTSWAWDFENDGIIDSTEQDPTWIYNSAGTYTVNLTVTNAAGSDSEVKTDFITVTPPQQGEPTIILSPSSPHVAEGTTCDFQLSISSLPEGLSGYDLAVTLSNPSIAEITGVQYPGWAGMNNTTPLPQTDSLRLSGVDLGRNIQAGAEDVLLATITVRADSMGTSAIAISNVNMDADGGSIITPDISSGQVVVHAPLVADFTANVTSGKASLARPLFVQFTDLSTGDPPVSSWSWDFDNDGVVDSTLQDPVASFNKPGNYTVNLTVQNTYSSDTEVKVDYIRVTSLVKPFPGQTSEPTDPDGDGLYEDINGNGRLDYDDVVIYYDNMQWIRDQPDVGIEPYDYNGNGRIDYDDVVLLYEEVLDSRP
jgi:PKD repeat protein